MKEQCLEELQKNGSLPLDVYKQIVHGMCINDCSDHGQCRNGRTIDVARTNCDGLRFRGEVA